MSRFGGGTRRQKRGNNRRKVQLYVQARVNSTMFSQTSCLALGKRPNMSQHNKSLFGLFFRAVGWKPNRRESPRLGNGLGNQATNPFFWALFRVCFSVLEAQAQTHPTAWFMLPQPFQSFSVRTRTHMRGCQRHQKGIHHWGF